MYSLSLMNWNWQQPEWPAFSWDAARMRPAEERFLLETGMFAGTLRHILASERETLTIEAIGTEALTTSAIEGETLDRASVQPAKARRRTGRGPSGARS